MRPDRFPSTVPNPASATALTRAPCRGEPTVPSQQIKTKETEMVMVPRKRPGKPAATRRPAVRVVKSSSKSSGSAARRGGTRPRARDRRGLSVLMGAYLAGACIVLAAVFLAFPHRSGGPPAPGSHTWDYQLETVALQGRGLLNAYARGAVRTSAWLARSSIERQRDVHRLNLLEYLAGEPAAAATGRFVAAHRLALEGGTIALLVGLAAYGLLRRPRGLGWLVAVLALLAVTAVVTRPVSASRLAGQAGVAVPNLVLRAAVQGDPTQELRGGTQQVQEALAGGYWTAFVAEPLSRLQTGTAVLADAPPTRKPGVLGFLRGRIGAVNDWAVGRDGVERSVISTFAVVYVLPFALVLCALAMLAGAVVLLSATALVSFLVVRTAELLHASDEYAGLLLAGSVWPVLGGALLARRFVRRRRGARRRPIVVRGGAA